MPISSLLARIGKLVPRGRDHDQEIAPNSEHGALRAPAKPMSDHELSRAISEFLKRAPTTDSAISPAPKLDPRSRK